MYLRQAALKVLTTGERLDFGYWTDLTSPFHVLVLLFYTSEVSKRALQKEPRHKFLGCRLCLREQVLKKSLWYFTVMQQRFSRDLFLRNTKLNPVPGGTKSCLLNLSSFVSILHDLEWEIKEKLI